MMHNVSQGKYLGSFENENIKESIKKYKSVIYIFKKLDYFHS